MKLKFFTLFVLLTLVFTPFLFSQQTGQNYIWRVNLDISISGEYSIDKGNNSSLKGSYFYTILLSGSIEQDSDGDYIFYEGETQFTEKNFIKQEDGDYSNLTENFNPELKINYILRINENISFDIETSSITITSSSGTNYTLMLPRSHINKYVNKDDNYNEGINKGTNKIIIPESEFISSSQLTKNFSWDWTIPEESNKNSSHNVTISLRINRESK